MTKHDFHHFQVRHFNNVFEQSWCHCRVGATSARRSNCLQTRRIHHQVKYWRLNANTCIVAAILFSGHPYIGRHYRASLIICSSQLTNMHKFISYHISWFNVLLSIIQFLHTMMWLSLLYFDKHGDSEDLRRLLAWESPSWFATSNKRFRRL